ncbi:MAG: MFS transporter [Cyanobacteria bacterium REEB67]|nr:MFS transporter [Cyanobacteria bacterium REEB67]
MSTNSPQATKIAPPKNRSATSRLFISAYIVQGISQHFCLIAQPLNNFLKGALRLDAASVSLAVSLLMLPWVIKPIYGLVSDCGRFSRNGPARRIFLTWVHLLAASAYLALALILMAVASRGPSALLLPLLVGLVSLAGLCIAFATVVFVAMTVDRSHMNESARLYFGQQAVAYSCANIVSVYLGGQLCSRLPAVAALTVALTLSALPLLCLPFVLRHFLAIIDRSSASDFEESPPLPAHSQPSFFASLKRLASSKPYLVTLAFLIFWNLSPNLGVSLYFYECDKLKFTQSWIGALAACTSAGSLLGSFAFRYRLADYFQRRNSTYVLVVMGGSSALSYLLLSTPLSGIAIELCRGFVFMVSTLAIYGLAADVSPKELSASAMAIQIAVLNLAMEGSIALGGFLYERIFHKELMPLIAVSSLTTLLTAFLVPYLGASPKNEPLATVVK